MKSRKKDLASLKSRSKKKKITNSRQNIKKSPIRSVKSRKIMEETRMDSRIEQETTLLSGKRSQEMYPAISVKSSNTHRRNKLIKKSKDRSELDRQKSPSYLGESKDSSRNFGSKNRSSKSPMRTIKTQSQKAREILELIANERTLSIYKLIVKSQETEYNHDRFDLNSLEFRSKLGGYGNTHKNPLSNSPESFFRTICLQFDILITGEAKVLVKEMDLDMFKILLEVMSTASECIDPCHLVNQVVHATGNSSGFKYVYLMVIN